MMTRTYYRMSLSALCALAAFAAPIWFLEDKPRAGYLLGGLTAALLAWAFLTMTMLAEKSLPPLIQGVLGAGAAVLSWATISLVAVFDVIPKVLNRGLDRFDPVWIMAGLSPLVILLVALWRTRKEPHAAVPALLSSLLRFSAPLFGLQLMVRVLPLPKQYVWLFLFTGVMFLVLDAVGTGRDLPLLSTPSEKPKGE